MIDLEAGGVDVRRVRKASDNRRSSIGIHRTGRQWIRVDKGANRGMRLVAQAYGWNRPRRHPRDPQQKSFVGSEKEGSVGSVVSSAAEPRQDNRTAGNATELLVPHPSLREPIGVDEPVRRIEAVVTSIGERRSVQPVRSGTGNKGDLGARLPSEFSGIG